MGRRRQWRLGNVGGGGVVDERRRWRGYAMPRCDYRPSTDDVERRRGHAGRFHAVPLAGFSVLSGILDSSFFFFFFLLPKV